MDYDFYERGQLAKTALKQKYNDRRTHYNIVVIIEENRKALFATRVKAINHERLLAIIADN